MLLQVAHPMQVIQLSVPFEYVVLLQGTQMPALGPSPALHVKQLPLVLLQVKHPVQLVHVVPFAE
jgi:hypothetical protein